MEYDSSDFYYPDVKIEFLISIEDEMKPQSLLAFKVLLSTFKEIEVANRTDLCDMSYETLIDAFNHRLSRSRSSKDTQLSNIRRYITWCIEQNIKKTIDNPIQSITSKDVNPITKVRTTLLASPEQLNEILDIILDSANGIPAINIMDRMVCWLLYDGITPKEVLELRKENVDFYNNTIKTSDGSSAIMMSNNLRELVLQAVDIKETLRTNTHGGYSILKLDPSDRLYRKIFRKDLVYDLKSLRSKLAAYKQKHYDNTGGIVSLSPENLWLSGLFYRLYMREKRGEKLKNENFRYNIEECNNVDSIRNKIRNNRREYNDWKKTINYKL